MDGDDLRALPLSMRKASLERLLHRRPDGIFYGQLRTRRDRTRAVQEGLRVRARGLGLKARRSRLSRRTLERLGQGEEPRASRDGPSEGVILGKRLNLSIER